MAGFSGFPTETLTFLRGLRRHNNKQWFHDHRSDYEQYYIEPAKEFVLAAGAALQAIAPGIDYEPKVNGSIFRVNRDIRFSADKTPYKDHIDVWFWEGPSRREAVSGFYFRIAPDAVGVGVGAHGFDKHRLVAYRDAAVGPSSGPALIEAVAAVGKAGFPAKGEHYKTLPRGYEAEGETARLLRYRALWTGEDVDIPASLHNGRLLQWCMTRWKKQLPLHRWLVDHL